MRQSVRFCGIATAVLIAAACAVNDEQNTSLTLKGDVSAVYESGRFVLFLPSQRRSGSSGASMTAASTSMRPAGTAQQGKSSDLGLNIVAEAPVVDGKFSGISIEVSQPYIAYFYVLDGMTKDGMRMGPRKGSNFVLEPGTLSLVLNERGEPIVSGGRLNDIVYNSWTQSSEYLDTQEEYQTMLQPVEGESEDESYDRKDAASEVFSRILNLETEARKNLALNHEDPLVRKLVLKSTWLGGDWMLEAFKQLAVLMPADPWVQERVASWRDRAVNKAVQEVISSGGQILDFTADTLDGESVQLENIRADSKVILVEFWASWCGPCREEIPHMKQAYEKYGEMGFEIVSFTIDDSREAWEEASLEEQIPWHDLGMGQEAEAATAYGITGVPKNYLVDSATGSILDEDLRGHKLDRKLEEIFGEKDT